MTRASSRAASGSTSTRRAVDAAGNFDAEAAEFPQQAREAGRERRGPRTGTAGGRTCSKEGGTDLVGWVDERTGRDPVPHRNAVPEGPEGTNWFYTLGSATLFAFVVQAITGVFPAMYYTPSPVEAYLVDHPSHQRRVPRRVRARHAQMGISVMIIS